MLNFRIHWEALFREKQMEFSKSTHIDRMILKALHELGNSAGASTITTVLAGMGISLHPRSVRYHLLKMDRDGLTVCPARRKGRQLTEKGLQELHQADVITRVGFVSARVDELGYRMTLNAGSDTGTIIPNIALIGQKDLARAIHFMTPVYETGLSIGDLVAYKMYGEQIGGVIIPRGKIALATICSMTINSIFTKEGIPVTSRFGGLLRMNNRIPVRFQTIIDYGGTSIDPMKLFILAGLTDVWSCAKTGDGLIGASFREFPSVAYEQVVKLLKHLHRKFNFKPVIVLGRPNMPLLEIPVSEGRTAMVVLGGLNPFAVLHEKGVPADIRPLEGLEALSTFKPFEDAAPIGRNELF